MTCHVIVPKVTVIVTNVKTQHILMLTFSFFNLLLSYFEMSQLVDGEPEAVVTMATH